MGISSGFEIETTFSSCMRMNDVAQVVCQKRGDGDSKSAMDERLVAYYHDTLPLEDSCRAGTDTSLDSETSDKHQWPGNCLIIVVLPTDVPKAPVLPLPPKIYLKDHWSPNSRKLARLAFASPAGRPAFTLAQGDQVVWFWCGA